MLGLATAVAAQAPNVAVSIRPIHSLVTGVMGDSGAPALIVNGYGSPHVYQMRPSEARALARADVVFWIGESLETFMSGPIGNLSRGARVVSLLEADGLDLHPARADTLWEDGHDHDSDPQAADPHVWLAPGNAQAIVDAIVAVLAEIDTERSAEYAANGAAVKARIDALEADLDAALGEFAAVPFLAFHDSLHYFEDAFDLQAVGAVMLGADRQPGAGSLRALRQRVSESGVACVAVEPQFRPVLIDALTEGTALGRAELDPIGSHEPAPADRYFDMMRTNADNLARCLGDAP